MHRPGTLTFVYWISTFAGFSIKTVSAGTAHLEAVPAGIRVQDYNNIIEYVQELEDLHNIEIRFVYNQFIIYPAGPGGQQ
jgi:hypothetical protein